MYKKFLSFRISIFGLTLFWFLASYSVYASRTTAGMFDPLNYEWDDVEEQEEQRARKALASHSSFLLKEHRTKDNYLNFSNSQRYLNHIPPHYNGSYHNGTLDKPSLEGQLACNGYYYCDACNSAYYTLLELEKKSWRCGPKAKEVKEKEKQQQEFESKRTQYLLEAQEQQRKIDFQVKDQREKEEKEQKKLKSLLRTF